MLDVVHALGVVRELAVEVLTSKHSIAILDNVCQVVGGHGAAGLHVLPRAEVVFSFDPENAYPAAGLEQVMSSVHVADGSALLVLTHLHSIQAMITFLQLVSVS